MYKKLLLLLLFVIYIKAMQENRIIPSLYGQAMAHIIKHQGRYVDTINILPEDLKETVQQLPEQLGFIYAQKGFADHYIQNHSEINAKTTDLYKAVDLVFYQSKQQRKKFVHYRFSQEAVELGEKFKKHYKNLEALKEDPSYQRLIALKKAISEIEKYKFNTPARAAIFNNNLVEALIYLTPSLFRKKLNKEIWEQAAYAGNIPTLSFFLNNGFSVNMWDGDYRAERRTALYKACFVHQKPTIDYLIERGAWLNKGESILSSVNLDGRKSNQEKQALGNYLIQQGADPNFEESAKINVQKLRKAIKNNEVQEVKDLLTADVPLPFFYGWKDNDGQHPLLIAARQDNRAIIQLLLSTKRIYSDPNDLTEVCELTLWNCWTLSKSKDCYALLRAYRDIYTLKATRKEEERKVPYLFGFELSDQKSISFGGKNTSANKKNIRLNLNNLYLSALNR